MQPLILVTTLFFMACSSVQAQDHEAHHKANKPVNKTAMKFEIPGSLQAEHKELHQTLEKFTQLPGKTGAAAKDLATVLHPHFMKEEEYALPPLGLLPDLAKGKTTSEMKAAIAMADKLKQDFQQMLTEHQHIGASLQLLYNAAKEEGQPEVIRFTEALKLHAKTEEEVLYPTAILIGEYLKLKL